MDSQYDVIVVGAGNAALCAALQAREGGARVLVLESAPASARGGNSFFSGGWMRFTHQGAEDLGKSFPELALAGTEDFDVLSYPDNEFFDDMTYITEFRGDPDLTSLVVQQSRNSMEWLHKKGVRFVFTFSKQGIKKNKRFQLGGGSIAVSGGGAGLVEKLFESAEEMGIEIQYQTRVIELLGIPGKRVNGVRIRNSAGELVDVKSHSVVLASGGFGASTEKRTRYLGPGWDLAKLRGSEFNLGDGLDMALAFGAKSAGHWSGSHAVAWDASAPTSGDRNRGNEFSRNSYTMGIMVNKNSERFLDEGVDFSAITYGKVGAEIMRQPDSMAFQIYDSKVLDILDPNYNGRQVSRITASTIEELAIKLELDPTLLRRTVDEFNASVDVTIDFDPNTKDGKATSGLIPKKSNWANAIDVAPFLAFPVTTGLTFTLGGIKVDEKARVIDTQNQPIEGLFGAGELVGGIFYYSSPSGAGLTAGTVLGRTAGREAALDALSSPS